MNLKKYFISWSGGKDACLAYYRSNKQFNKPSLLLNMMHEDGQRSRSHGLSKTVLEAQADALSIPIQFHPTSWDNYESTFLAALQDLYQKGFDIGVFGDIKLKNNPDWSTHCSWAEQICAKAHMQAYEPLWDDNETNILGEFITAGFKAIIIAVNPKYLDKTYLGKTLTSKLIDQFNKLGISPSGEQGEYHTLVIDGPLFKYPLTLTHKNAVLKSGCWFLDVSLRSTSHHHN